jgi:hypothetical protein
MNPIALNLVAVLIFTLTFSILLGPYLHISPAIPALATVSILGFTTLDALGFQGKGSTLFLDWFAQRSPLYRERMIRHEAGHFLVAHLLQIPITGYTLSAWEAIRQGHPGQGGVMFDSNDVEVGHLSAQLLDRYCIMWMAGGAAESLVYETVEGGNDDLLKLRTVLTRLRQEWQPKQQWAILQARKLLGENQGAYEALVEAMKRRASVAECTQVIDQHCNSPDQQVA